MIAKNSNIVKIDFNSNKGLILKWNFNGHLETCYFRHILIFDVGDGFETVNFLRYYYNKIKLGDMITMACINQHNQFIQFPWKQKNPLTNIEDQQLSPSIQDLEHLIKRLNKINLKTKDFPEPTFINVITQRNSKQTEQLYIFLKSLVEKRNTYCGNIFSNRATSIEIVTGVNFFSFEDFRNGDGWSFLGLFWSRIALLRAKITIQCQNGELSSQTNEQWKTVDFNKIERELKLPLIYYKEDVIQFLHQDPSDEINYVLNITLQYQQLNQECFKAEKKISIKTINEKIYQRTFVARQKSYKIQFESYNFIVSKRNPFYSHSLICYKKIQHDE